MVGVEASSATSHRECYFGGGIGPANARDKKKRKKNISETYRLSSQVAFGERKTTLIKPVRRDGHQFPVYLSTHFSLMRLSIDFTFATAASAELFANGANLAAASDATLFE